MANTQDVTYEELIDLEREFEDVETEIIRHQVQLTRPLYEKRRKMLEQIPSFWPLVLEQAPPEIDEFIQPSDSSVLLSCLKSISVSRFEIDNGGNGDPRSVSIKWEFAENSYFEDSVLEKKLWFRHARSGWAGLVSEPVTIRWKEGRDLTGGLLDLVKRVWEAEKQAPGEPAVKREEDGTPVFSPEQKELKKKIEEVGLGGMSFFAWFGFRGHPVSAEESREALEKQKKRRLEGRKDDEDDDDDDEYDRYDDELEIFPEGDTLAVTIAEDLWPGAIKYFTQAQEIDAMSDDMFESDSGGELDLEELDDGAGSEPPAKKRKA